MPVILRTIDELCRQKMRDVLFLTFKKSQECNWKNNPIRKQLIKWLDYQKIEWQPVMPFESEGSLNCYEGQIYLDAPFDFNNEQYKLIENHLQNPDGSMRLKNVGFYYLPLQIANQYSYRDEPEYFRNL